MRPWGLAGGVGSWTRDSARRPFAVRRPQRQPQRSNRGLAAGEARAYGRAMADEAISEALDRLHHALDQLESVVEAVVSTPAPLSDGRDDRLRAEVQAVIAELDRMIGGQRG